MNVMRKRTDEEKKESESSDEYMCPKCMTKSSILIGDYLCPECRVPMVNLRGDPLVLTRVHCDLCGHIVDEKKEDPICPSCGKKRW